MLKILKLIFNIIILIISFIIPKSKRYVIIGGWEGRRYADNSRAMFEYLQRHKNKLGLKRIFWYTNSPEIFKELKGSGHDVLMGINLRSIFWHLRSKTHYIDQNPRDILGFLSIRSNRINLWHGIPLKKIGTDLHPEQRLGNRCWRKWSSGGFWTDQYVLSTSEFAKEILVRSMNISKEKGLISSYPRNEKLYENNPRKLSDLDQMQIYYLPTYRSDGIKNPLILDNLDSFNRELQENNILMKIKPHFASRADWEIAGELSNIEVLESKEDVYDNLLETDLLITDYSSVFFDFLLTKKPILFYPYDLEKYRDVERGFTMSYEEHTPGDKVYTCEELIEAIVQIRNNYDFYIRKHEDKANKINRKMNKYIEKENYEALLKFFE